MKKTVLWMLVMVGVMLAGCDSGEGGNTGKGKDTLMTVEKTATETVVPKVGRTEVKTSEIVENTSESVATPLWDQEKSEKLSQFMTTWGATMKQAYQAYSPSRNVSLYGLSLPESVLGSGNKWQAVIDGQPIPIVWSEDGLGDSYELVAVYSDAESQPYLQQHVYFFTIVSGVPKVLVTSQNQGNDNDYLHFRETENTQLNEGFAEIVGMTSLSSEKSTKDNLQEIDWEKEAERLVAAYDKNLEIEYFEQMPGAGNESKMYIFAVSKGSGMHSTHALDVIDKFTGKATGILSQTNK